MDKKDRKKSFGLVTDLVKTAAEAKLDAIPTLLAMEYAYASILAAMIDEENIEKYLVDDAVPTIMRAYGHAAKTLRQYGLTRKGFEAVGKNGSC